MTTRSTDLARVFSTGDYVEYPVVATDILYQGSLIGENGSGYARPYVEGDRPLGFTVHNRCDNAAGAAGDLKVKVLQRGMVSLPLTSVAITDVGKSVWATDDDTFVYASNADGPAIGVIDRLDDERSGYAWVRFDFTAPARPEPGAKITAASEAHALNSTFSDTEAEAALNALGVAVNACITALENIGAVKAN